MMQRCLLLLGFLLTTAGLSLSAPAAESNATAAELTALLTAQAAAWNRGDLDDFMAVYAHTEDLRFASGDSITYGWRATLARYRSRYPDRTAMGTLAFSDLIVTPLAADAALVFGRWSLAREKGRPHGLFTLTFRRTTDGWRITQDHTSSAAP